jgi:Fe-S-cluster containining protein
MECNQCGACCIAPSISTVIPGTGRNKPAGIKCVHLSQEMRCMIYPSRPTVCREYTPTVELCGKSFSEAISRLTRLEILTSEQSE